MSSNKSDNHRDSSGFLIQERRDLIAENLSFNHLTEIVNPAKPSVSSDHIVFDEPIEDTRNIKSGRMRKNRVRVAEQHKTYDTSGIVVKKDADETKITSLDLEHSSYLDPRQREILNTIQKEDISKSEIIGLATKLVEIANKKIPLGGAKQRILFEDEENGFAVRRETYRKLFRTTYKRRPKANTPEDYTARDFLNEEYPDLVASGQLTRKELTKHDYLLVSRLEGLIQSLRKKSNIEISLTDILTNPQMSVAQKLDDLLESLNTERQSALAQFGIATAK